MREHETRRIFTERVEIDDAYLGSERPARKGHKDRGADGKTPFVAAVETDHEGRPRQTALQLVPGFTGAAIAKARLAASYEVYSDDLSCFGAVNEADCSHTITLTGGGRKSVEKACFRRVNTALGNTKSALTGTYRHVSAKHASCHLAEFEYRYNSRNDLAGMLERLAWTSLRTGSAPYRVITADG